MEHLILSMSTQDVIKKSFLESFTGTTTSENILPMIISLVVALLFGLFIALLYHKFFKGVVYNRAFVITIVGMTVLTCMVTLAISTNIVISLGMVGALSIVRYRTAIKDPLDLVYLFWSITTGITAGAQMYLLAVIAAVIMTIVLLIFNSRSARGKLYIAVVHYKDDVTTDAIKRAMGTTKYRIKSKTSRGDLTELALEVYVGNQSMVFAEKLRAIEGVEDVTTIQYDGEYHA